MAATLKWITSDISSVLPSGGHYNICVRNPPQLGQAKPRAPIRLAEGRGAVILFTKNLGSPFCEKEIRELVRIAQKPENITANVKCYIITHSVESTELSKYIREELELDLPDNVEAIGDAKRAIYSAYGVGELGYTALTTSSSRAKAAELDKEGIKFRLTRGTRWQANAAFAVDTKGVVRYVHIGRDAGDMANLEDVFRTVNH